MPWFARKRKPPPIRLRPRAEPVRARRVRSDLLEVEPLPDPESAPPAPPAPPAPGKERPAER